MGQKQTVSVIKEKKFDEKECKIIKVSSLAKRIKLIKNKKLIQVIETSPPIATNYLFDCGCDCKNDMHFCNDLKIHITNRQNYFHHSRTWIKYHCSIKNLTDIDCIVISNNIYNLLYAGQS